MGILGNILKTVGGVVGQTLIPIPGVGAAIGSAVGGAVGNAVDGGDKTAGAGTTAQTNTQQPQGKLDPTSILLQNLLSGKGNSGADSSGILSSMFGVLG